MSSAERPGAPNAGGTGARGALLLVAAVLLGLFLLNEYDTTPFSDDVETTDTTETTRRSATVSVVPSPSTRPLRPPEEIKVLPANGTSTSGLGGRTGEFLRAAGYNSLAPLDASRNLDATQVQHKPEFEAEARVLAQLLQLPASSVRPMEENPPVADTRGADIIVLIGADLRLPGEGAAAATTSTSRRL